MSTLYRLAAWLPAQLEPTVPGPTGPDAPTEVRDMVTLALNFALFVGLAICFAMAIWGLGSMAYAKKKNNFSAVNEGQHTAFLAVAGAAGTTVLRSVFAFFGL